MKNIYHILIVLLMILFTGHSESAFSQTLYPPTNLQGEAIEDGAYLTWDKPVNSTGQTPPGLVGYYIYRNGVQTIYIGDPDTVFYYDGALWNSYPLLFYTYTVTANYDMTSYGIPGVFQESSAAGPVTLYIDCSCGFPFTEPWNSGTFSFNDWQTDTNWTVDSFTGNPAPTAAYNGSPSVTDYDNIIYTIWLHGVQYLCGHMYLEFDYKLEDLNAGGTEKLTAEYLTDGDWQVKNIYTNNGSTDWTHVKTDISEVLGHFFRIGFRASGVNSSNISKWMVDNIHTYAVCEDVINLYAETNANVVTLTWDPVTCDYSNGFIGYNLWRTDGNGSPEFYKINSAPVPTTEYQDVLPPETPPATFKYRVTAEYEDTISGTIICESAGEDTVQVDYRLGTGSDKEKFFSVSPNPASTFVSVISSIHVESYELYDQLGKRIKVKVINNEKSFVIPLSGAEGFCYIRFRFADGSVRAEKILIH